MEIRNEIEILYVRLYFFYLFKIRKQEPSPIFLGVLKALKDHWDNEDNIRYSMERMFDE